MNIIVVTTKEFVEEVNMNSKKAPGFDLITGGILKKLPRKAIVKLTHLRSVSASTRALHL